MGSAILPPLFDTVFFIVSVYADIWPTHLQTSSVMGNREIIYFCQFIGLSQKSQKSWYVYNAWIGVELLLAERRRFSCVKSELKCVRVCEIVCNKSLEKFLASFESVTWSTQQEYLKSPPLAGKEWGKSERSERSWQHCLHMLGKYFESEQRWSHSLSKRKGREVHGGGWYEEIAVTVRLRLHCFIISFIFLGVVLVDLVNNMKIFWVLLQEVREGFI